ncbi:hypothetical protein [Haloarcula sediminis]|uniref:hypothetical protein n=1 Tax=Haloarcula sediminis TaxID=3111777 RepID=UPI002D784D53|nr:hypothetical protein [Haloarcula sp. CK38]
MSSDRTHSAVAATRAPFAPAPAVAPAHNGVAGVPGGALSGGIDAVTATPFWTVPQQ